MKPATGQKVKKTFVKTGSPTVTTEYLDGFQYKRVNNGATNLEFFGTAEGFYAAGKYHYQYKDHLGNVRMTYADDNNNGIVTATEIKEENHYYPYGLKHVGYGATPTLTNDAKKYKYNGKEEQEELGLNVTAMDFRQYDNALGRFLCIDALSEKNHYLSPYNFADGNPVIYSDPSGLDSASFGDYDYLGRERFDRFGMYITPNDRGPANMDMVRHLALDGGSGGGDGGSGNGDFSNEDGINVVVLPANIPAHDLAMQNIMASALKDLDKSVLVLFVKNIEDLVQQLKDNNVKLINTLINCSHGSYEGNSLKVGNDNLIEKKDFQKLGKL